MQEHEDKRVKHTTDNQPRKTGAGEVIEKGTLMAWAKSWTWGRKGKAADVYDLPSDKVIKQAAKYVPKQPVTLYRAHTPGQKHEELQSWSHDKELIEQMADDMDREVLVKTFHPDQIMIDFDMLDPQAKKYVLQTDFSEVVVANGKTLERLRAVRGHTDVQKSLKAGLWMLRKSNPHDVTGEKRDGHGRWSIEVADFKERLLDHKAAMLDPRQPVSLMQNTPDIYLQLGAQDRPIEITFDAIDKILSSPFKRSDGHELPVEVAKELPKALYHPIMVFRPDPEPVAGKKRPEWAQNSFVVITEIEHKDKPLIVILQMDIQAGGRTNLVHRISSSYEKPEAKIKDWISKGLLLMADKNKGLDWLRSKRLYRHVDGTSLQALTPSHTILFKSIGVNCIVQQIKSLRSGLRLQKSRHVGHGLNDGASGIVTPIGQGRIQPRNSVLSSELRHDRTGSDNPVQHISVSSHNALQKSELPSADIKPPEQNDISFHAAGLHLITKSNGGNNARTDRRAEVRKEGGTLEKSTCGSGRNGQEGCKESCGCKEGSQGKEAAGQASSRGTGAEKLGAAIYGLARAAGIQAFMLRKSR